MKVFLMNLAMSFEVYFLTLDDKSGESLSLIGAFSFFQNIMDIHPLWIDISTSKRQLKLFDDSILIKSYPIAVGKILTPNPRH